MPDTSIELSLRGESITPDWGLSKGHICEVALTTKRGMSLGKDDAIAAFLLGTASGIGVAALIAHLMSPKCPACGAKLAPGTTPCPNCKVELVWSN